MGATTTKSRVTAAYTLFSSDYVSGDLGILVVGDGGEGGSMNKGQRRWIIFLDYYRVNDNTHHNNHITKDRGFSI